MVSVDIEYIGINLYGGEGRRVASRSRNGLTYPPVQHMKASTAGAQTDSVIGPSLIAIRLRRLAQPRDSSLRAIPRASEENDAGSSHQSFTNCEARCQSPVSSSRNVERV